MSRYNEMLSGMFAAFDSVRTSPYRLGSWLLAYLVVNNEHAADDYPFLENASTSLVTAVIPAWVAGMVAGGVSERPRVIRATAMTAAGLAGIAVNTVMETAFVQHISGYDAIPDHTVNQSAADFMIGMGAAIFSSVVIRTGRPLAELHATDRP